MLNSGHFSTFSIFGLFFFFFWLSWTKIPFFHSLIFEELQPLCKGRDGTVEPRILSEDRDAWSPKFQLQQLF